MRDIEIKGHKYSEDESYPMWQVIKRIENMNDAISITLVMAKTHEEAMKISNETEPLGEVIYITSIFNLFQRLEFLHNNESRR